MKKKMGRKAATRNGHAIVIGGSTAGILSARVLADHYERVTIVEHDPFPDGSSPRKGVPQGKHLHVLLMRGRLILEHFFPGITTELVKSGAIALDVTQDLAWLTPAGWAVRFPSDLAILGCSRDVVDWQLLKRLGAHSGVRFLERHVACGLTGTRSRVTGVTLKPLDRASVENWKADIVVDASGRASRTPQWLEGLGVPRVEEEVVDAYLGYSSRMFRRESDFLRDDWRALYLQPAPPDRPRGGAIFPVENGRWVVTLIGGNKDYPPHNEQGFMSFAERVGDPVFLEILKTLKPVSPISTFRATGNRMRHFERVKPWPEGIAILGDAACAFNPVYAQGVTMAALGAQTLSDWLRSPEKASFQEMLAHVNEVPWLLATSEDFRYEHTKGLYPGQTTRLLHNYVDRVVALSTREVKVRRRFAEVLHLLKPVTSLFEPRILLKVLLRSRRAG